MKIIYEPVKFKVDSKGILQALKKYEACFIAYTAQYCDLFKNIKNSGLVLGCNVNSINNFKGDIIIFVGDGVFHPLMIKKKHLDKKVIILNPKDLSEKEVLESDVKKFINREFISLERLKMAKKVAIIACTKPGQERIKISELLKKKLEAQGKKVYLLLAETINPDEFMNYRGFDILINTACSRIGLDDYSKFNIPIINYEIVLTKYF
ncbi:MAG: diphthamide synthesis protein [Candidatus Nanoarchaeia archaeon]|nr:diphthamide synthesis protein [Candidatus Nanoarchaeia archaeon]